MVENTEKTIIKLCKTTNIVVLCMDITYILLNKYIFTGFRYKNKYLSSFCENIAETICVKQRKYVLLLKSPVN